MEGAPSASARVRGLASPGSAERRALVVSARCCSVVPSPVHRRRCRSTLRRSVFSARVDTVRTWGDYVRSDRSRLSWSSDGYQPLLRSLPHLVRSTTSEAVSISYSDDMDHLLILRDKIGRLREEIADIQKLNEQFRGDGLNGTDAQVAHGQRNERLQAIQHELVQLGDLGRKVVATDQMREKNRTRLHLIKKRAS